MTAQHRVLMVGDAGVILYAQEDKGLSRMAAIDWAAPDFAQKMASAVSAERHDAITVLLNDSNPTYRKEENINIADLDRYLEKVFPHFAARAFMEVPGGGAEDHNYLLVGMPECEIMSRLGTALAGAHAPLSGFGLLPVESTGLVETLAAKCFQREGAGARWAILIGQHETGGLRDVTVRNGNLALTRLIPVPDVRHTDAATWSAAVMRELAVTLNYLSRFGYREQDGMDVMIVCAEAGKKLFAPLPGTRLRCMTQAEALGLLGFSLHGKESEGYADALHAAWAAHQETLKMNLPVMG